MSGSPEGLNTTPDKEVQRKVDTALGGIVGAVMGAAGILAEINILSADQVDLSSALLAGGVAAVGISLLVNAGVRAYTKPGS